jgi:hypothetical protein
MERVRDFFLLADDLCPSVGARCVVGGGFEDEGGRMEGGGRMAEGAW